MEELNKGHLESIYDNIQQLRKERDSHIDVVTQLDRKIQVALLEYRINSVYRVLDFIHSNLSNKEKLNFDTLITHCCNKLSGNIDGIEINLKVGDKNV